MNRKIMSKIISSDLSGKFSNCVLLEADDGQTAVETMLREQTEGRRVDVVLMDFVMVSFSFILFSI